MSFESFSAILTTRLGSYVTLTEAEMSVLYTHFRLLLAWNERLNLSSIRRPEEIAVRHYCECLFFASRIAPAPLEGWSIADIGSGAGFPGLPIAALRPAWHITLIESHQRKAVFLRESTRELHNVVVLAERAEGIKKRFDWIVSRAVRPADVVEHVPGLASRVGLLLSERDFNIVRQHSRISWQEPVPIPWAKQTVCAFGAGKP